MSTTPEQLLYEDLAASLAHWTDEAVAALTNPRADLTWCESPEAFRRLQRKLGSSEDAEALTSVMSELLRGQIHSVLVSLDGGTKMAEAQQIVLATVAGKPLPRDLHEGFIRFLVSTGRLK